MKGRKTRLSREEKKRVTIRNSGRAIASEDAAIEDART
jgi:hypothetical protein